MTLPTKVVLAVLLDAPAADHYGLDIAEKAGLKSGSLYPILGRLEDRGWLASRWEDIDPAAEGRPRRRYYRLTADGYSLAREALAGGPTPLFTWASGGAP